MKKQPVVLALDLEGTLISNAVSQIPRPGLFEFLVSASAMFPRVVVFTTVEEEKFRVGRCCFRPEADLKSAR